MEMQLVHAAIDGQLLINSVFLKAILFSVRSFWRQQVGLVEGNEYLSTRGPRVYTIYYTNIDPQTVGYTHLVFQSQRRRHARLVSIGGRRRD